jgi:DNA mismatch repair protein MutS2
LEIGKDFHTLIITGPNAGGKTVALKTIGILTLMASCGLHIPAAPDSRVPLFNKIFIDIGDEQSIENDLSSFTSHLLNLKRILDETDNRSLVLVDEIGAGTDPTEGGALAAAVLTGFALKGSLTIATTHHGALKAFAHETPGFENGAMEFDQTTLRPTYRFKCGIPGSSYAIEIASRHGLPETVIVSAKELLGSRHDRLESLIAEVEKKAQQLDAKHRLLEQQNAKLAKLIEEYESKHRVLSREVKEKRASAIREAQQIIDRANALIESSVREIKAQSAASSAIREAKSNVQSMKESLSSELRALEGELAEGSSSEVISEGDFVKLRGHSGVGQVISRSGGNTALVEFDGVRMQVSSKDLMRTSVAAIKPRATDFITVPLSVKTEIDLRGMTAEEAVAAVDKFLDGATLSGLPSVNIIHGKGTGILRRRVAAFLQGDPRVKSFRLGEWNEGGSGATVVYLQK